MIPPRKPSWHGDRGQQMLTGVACGVVFLAFAGLIGLALADWWTGMTTLTDFVQRIIGGRP